MTPAPPRRRRKLVPFLGVTYFGVLGLLLALEPVLLFPGWLFSKEVNDPPPGLPLRDLTLDSGDGETIHAWLYVPPGWTPAKGAVLYCHGNGESLSRLPKRVKDWAEATDRAAMIFDYPGYGKSTGRPTEAGCHEASETAWQYLMSQGVPAKEVVVVGQSLGGAMAIEVAARREVRLLVLVNAFTSFPDMAQRNFPWFPGRYLVRHSFDNATRLRDVACPVHVTHGTADVVVPYRMGERLFSLAPGRKRFYPREGMGHAHPREPEYFADVRAFMDR